MVMKTLGAVPDSLEKLRPPEENVEKKGRGGGEREQPRDQFPIRNFVFPFDPHPFARPSSRNKVPMRDDKIRSEKFASGQSGARSRYFRRIFRYWNVDFHIIIILRAQYAARKLYFNLGNILAT